MKADYETVKELKSADVQPVCVIVGVGPGNGAAFARRFDRDGYAVALRVRSDEYSRQLASGFVAATAAMRVAQPRSAWTFELEARPFGETW